MCGRARGLYGSMVRRMSPAPHVLCRGVRGRYKYAIRDLGYIARLAGFPERLVCSPPLAKSLAHSLALAQVCVRVAVIVWLCGCASVLSVCARAVYSCLVWAWVAGLCHLMRGHLMRGCRLQGMDPHVRERTSHVLYESNTWVPAFNLSISLSTTLLHLVQNIATLPTPVAADSDTAVAWSGALRGLAAVVTSWSQRYCVFDKALWSFKVRPAWGPRCAGCACACAWCSQRLVLPTDGGHGTRPP